MSAITTEQQLEALAHIYAEAMLRGQATGFLHGLRVGFDVGAEVQAMNDEELVEALGQYVADQEKLGRDVAAVMRSTVGDLNAIAYRRKTARQLDRDDTRSA